MVEIISRIGIASRNVTTEQTDRVVTLLITTYGKLTTEDLKTALELWLEEKLTTPGGEALSPLQHFQNFSPAYVAQWLNAYGRYRLSAISEIGKILPKEEDKPKTAYEIVREEFVFRLGILNEFSRFMAADQEGRAKVLSDPLPYWKALAYMALQESGAVRVSDEFKFDAMDRAKGQIGAEVAKEATTKLERLGAVIETILVEKSDVQVTRAKAMCYDEAFRMLSRREKAEAYLAEALGMNFGLHRTEDLKRLEQEGKPEFTPQIFSAFFELAQRRGDLQVSDYVGQVKTGAGV